MKLYVKVIAFSEEDGVKATEEDLVEIPDKIARLTEAVMGKDPHASVTAFATSALIAAISTVRIGPNQNASASLTALGGGPIGGPRPTTEANGDPGAAPQGGIESMLGLDIIDHMDAKERGSRPNGPGPVGFGPHRSR